MTTTTTNASALEKKLKKINRDITLLTHAVGIMEVDGWFGGAPTTDGLSKCEVDSTFGHETYKETICADGGAVCAGVAIHVAAYQYATDKRWNLARKQRLVDNTLDLFCEKLDLTIEPNGLFRGIARWNDTSGVDYEQVKAGFATVLQKLTADKWKIVSKLRDLGKMTSMSQV